MDSVTPPLKFLSSARATRLERATYSSALDPADKFVTGGSANPLRRCDRRSSPIRMRPRLKAERLLMVSMDGEDSKLAGLNLVHELVHSAFPSSRPWVYEGLAHFAEAIYRQAKAGARPRSIFLDSPVRLSGCGKRGSAAPAKKRIPASRWPPHSTRPTIAAKRPTSGGCCATWSATTR